MARRNAASSSGRYSSPRRSLKKFESNDCDDFDANSFYGNSSAISSAFGSVIGHDDPTAVMTNVRQSSDDSTVLPSSSTMNSMIYDARNPDNIGRARPQTPSFDEDEELQEQLSELDRTEGEWKARRTLHSTRNDDIMADTLMNDTENPQKSTRKHRRSRRSSDTIGDERDKDYREDDRPTTPPSQRGKRSGTGNPSGRGGRSNTSGRSSTLGRVNASVSSDEFIVSMEEGLGHTHTKKPRDMHRETDEIIRQVQKRLTGPLNLASKTDLSTDARSDDDEKNATGSRKCRILLILFILGIIALVLYFWKVKGGVFPGSKAVADLPNDGGSSGPIDEPVDDLTVSSPPPSWMKPTLAPTTTVVSDQTLGPLEPERLSDRFFPLSGDLVYDPSAPQFEAIKWLEDEDLTSLNLDTLPEQTLYERYIAALLHFSMNGVNWEKRYGFLGPESVCEWQDETNGKGILCSETGTIEAIVISKYQNP
jgi:hypothetical protein